MSLIAIRHGQASYAAADYDQLSEAGYRLQELPPTGLGEYPLSVGFTVRINLNAIVYREPPEPQLWTLFGPPELEYGPHYLAPGRIAPPGWIPTAPPLPPPPPLPQLPTLPEDMNSPLDEYLEIAHRYLEVVDEILSRTA